MADPWLDIVGIGEDGLAGTGPAARDAIAAADIIFGAERHLQLAQAGARGVAWPVPFSVGPLLAARGRRCVALVSGDPFWYGAGGSLMAHLQPGEWRSHPVASTFSLATSRLGWRIEETVCLGLHAAPFARLRSVLSDGVKAICLVRDGAAAGELAAWLGANGFAASKLTVLEALGGPRERVRETAAAGYELGDVEHPVAVAVEARGEGGLPRASGLPDAFFEHDGQITKRPVRALTLSALGPRPGETLWDIGAGSGSVSIEFLLAAPASRALAIEADEGRAARIGRNAAAFGVEHRLTVVGGEAPGALSGLPAPSAVFVGGGGSEALFEALWRALPPGVRVVANAVTLESEALFAQLCARHGGSLLRIELAEARPLGTRRGWRSAMPVVQWSVTR